MNAVNEAKGSKCPERRALKWNNLHFKQMCLCMQNTFPFIGPIYVPMNMAQYFLISMSLSFFNGTKNNLKIGIDINQAPLKKNTHIFKFS